MTCLAPAIYTCCVCGGECVPGGSIVPHDRWSWGPDGLHCHQRCEGGFAAVLRSRGIGVPDYVAAREKGSGGDRGQGA